jgi:hypothetical protein
MITIMIVGVIYRRWFSIVTDNYNGSADLVTLYVSLMGTLVQSRSHSQSIIMENISLTTLWKDFLGREAVHEMKCLHLAYGGCCSLGDGYTTTGKYYLHHREHGFLLRVSEALQRSYNAFLVCPSVSQMPKGMLGMANGCLGWF